MTIWEAIAGGGALRVIYIIVGVLAALLVVFLVLPWTDCSAAPLWRS